MARRKTRGLVKRRRGHQHDSQGETPGTARSRQQTARSCTICWRLAARRTQVTHAQTSEAPFQSRGKPLQTHMSDQNASLAQATPDEIVAKRFPNSGVPFLNARGPFPNPRGAISKLTGAIPKLTGCHFQTHGCHFQTHGINGMMRYLSMLCGGSTV